eukprot:15409-Eustigmatos_ZCMA.PRE.1
MLLSWRMTLEAICQSPRRYSSSNSVLGQSDGAGMCDGGPTEVGRAQRYAHAQSLLLDTFSHVTEYPDVGHMKAQAQTG